MYLPNLRLEAYLTHEKKRPASDILITAKSAKTNGKKTPIMSSAYRPFVPG